MAQSVRGSPCKAALPAIGDCPAAVKPMSRSRTRHKSAQSRALGSASSTDNCFGRNSRAIADRPGRLSYPTTAIPCTDGQLARPPDLDCQADIQSWLPARGAYSPLHQSHRMRLGVSEDQVQPIAPNIRELPLCIRGSAMRQRVDTDQGLDR